MEITSVQSPSQKVTRAVSDEVNRLKHESHFLQRVLGGYLTKEELVKYLFNIRWSITHTYPNLIRAAELSLLQNNQALSTFFNKKAIEERGHERWADSDLSNLGYGNYSDEITPAFKSFQSTVKENLEANPMTYLMYAYLVEALTVELGPKFLASLQSSMGVAPEQVSVVSRHVEADQDHHQENEAVLEQFIVTDSDANQCLAIMKTYAVLMGQALDSVVDDEIAADLQ